MILLYANLFYMAQANAYHRHEKYTADAVCMKILGLCEFYVGNHAFNLKCDYLKEKQVINPSILLKMVVNLR